MFHGWDSFYLLIGSAAAALIGLLFVVATLTTQLERSTASRGASIYMTPTVFHLAVVLTVSAMALAPEVGTAAVALIVGACALAGFLYAMTVTVRLRLGRSLEPPHWSDVWCYGAAPAAVYLALGANVAAAWKAPAWLPYGTGSALLALLLVGIRNAWDLVTWLAPRH